MRAAEIRRCKKRLSETVLFSLEENVVLLAAMGERGRTFRGGGTGGSKAQAGTQGPSMGDNKKLFFTVKVVKTGRGSRERFKRELGVTWSNRPQLALL